MESGNHETIGRSSEIDEKAQRFMRAHLGLPFFRVREWRPDTFLDYVLEGVENGEPTGVLSFVQLKGQEKVTVVGGEISFALPTKHLNYYDARLALPVWLVLVDVTNQRGYFLFVQEWLDRHVAGRLADQEAVTLKIPASNDLTVLPLFRERHAAAARYMHAKHPGSVDDAINAVVGQWEKLDPRFKVTMHVSGPWGRLEFRAKEPVRVDVTPNHPEAPGKLDQLRAVGQRAVFAPGEVSIQGTPLFAKMKMAAVVLEPAQSAPAELIVSEKSTGLLFTAQGRAAVGAAGVTFEGGLFDAPLTLWMTIRHDREKKQDIGEVRLSWNFSIWVGRPVAQIAHASTLRDFAGAVAAQRTVEAELRINGEKITVGVFVPGVPTLHELGARDMLGLLNEARLIAQKLSKDFRVPDTRAITDEDRDTIETCFDLLNSGSHTTVAKEITVRATYRAGRDENIPQLLNREPEPAPLEITFPDQPFRLFGEVFSLGAITFRFASATIEIASGNLEQFQNGKTDDLAVVFRASPDTSLELRRTAK